MKIFLVLLVAAILAACSTSPDATSSENLKPAPEQSKKRFAHIKKQIQSGQSSQGMKDLEQLRSEERGTDLEPEIEWLAAQEDMRAKNYMQAGSKYLKTVRSSKSYDRKLEACQQATVAFEKAESFTNATKAINYCLAFKGWQEGQVATLIQIQGDLYSRSGQRLLALKSYVELIQSPGFKDVDNVRQKALVVVQEKLTADELRAVGEDADFGFLRGHAWFRLGSQMLEERNNAAAVYAFKQVEALLPGTDLSDSAQQSIVQMESLKKVSPSTVGVILPISGKNAAVGVRVLRGLQLGLGLNGSGASPFKLAIIDDENNPDIARRAVDRLVKEDNVIGIVGSLSSKTAMAVASQAQALGVPSIALSQKAGITDVGPLVYRNALTSQAQVRQLVRVAMQDMSLKRFAILYPNDKFGTEYANIFWDEVLARGGEIRAAQVYDPEDLNGKNTVQRLIGTFYTEDRSEELRTNYKAWEETQQKKTARTEAPDDLISPAVDFDAVFIADGVKALGQMASMLAFHNVRGVKVLGPNLWNTDSVIKRTGGNFNQLIFVDGAQAKDEDALKNNFIKEYKSLYGELPGAFELQGFDSALILRQALAEGASSREDLAEKLQSMQSVSGVLGTLSFSPDREILRPVITLTVENNAIVPFVEKSKQ